MVGVGGGGIPVIEDEQGNLKGVFAVIDKDRASALLAAEMKVDLLLISTAVEKVAINFNKPDQKWLDSHPVRGQEVPGRGPLPVGQHGAEDRGHHRLPGGQPERQGPDHRPARDIVDALDGKTGTWIVQD